MSQIRVLMLAVLAVSIGSFTLMGAPTDEEKKAEKYTKVLKTSKDAKEKVTALKELGTLGVISSALVKDARPEIVKALDDKDATVRGEAAHTAGRLAEDEKKKELVEKLTKMIKDEKDEQVRFNIALGLGAMGPEAKSAVPAIKDAAAKADKKGAKMYQTVISGITGKGK
jgi:HEAT repeat protein